jgi:UDP-2,3-diacylglucosamine pyrophosphatase LpxH
MIGHIHTPAIESGKKSYYNTGDFCESCSYLIETITGDIELHYCDKTNTL